MIADVLNKPIMKRALALSVAREETAGAKRLMRAISVSVALATEVQQGVLCEILCMRVH
jgi:hypothetical protein